jgi:hypothetical protein
LFFYAIKISISFNSSFFLLLPSTVEITIFGIEKGKGNYVGMGENITDLDTAVSNVLGKMYRDGIKPKVTSVSLGDNDIESFSNRDGTLTKINIFYKIIVNESDDGLAHTGFVSRKKARDLPITDFRFYENEKNINLFGSIIQEIKSRYGTLPEKIVEVGDIKRTGNINYKPNFNYRHVFWNYTDKNPKGIEP